VHRYTTSLADVWLNDSFPFVFYAFVPGMLVAALEVRRPNTFRTLGDGRALAVGIMLIGIGAISSWLPIKIATLAGAPLVVGWLLNHRVPATRALVFGGGASYALYLWNYDLYFRFGPLGVVIAVIGSALSWAIVERPILNWAHRRSAHWHIRPIATEATEPAPKPAAVA
jgi:peptidoglycan/LPS O-acetylase OafA/YrhL